jgi:hypothetical protein
LQHSQRDFITPLHSSGEKIPPGNHGKSLIQAHKTAFIVKSHLIYADNLHNQAECNINLKKPEKNDSEVKFFNKSSRDYITSLTDELDYARIAINLISTSGGKYGHG